MEAYSNRPTEGCLGVKSDSPIFQRSSKAEKLIRINSNRPVGYKAHFLREVHARDMAARQDQLGIILLTRDPVAAISSHAVRILSSRRKFPWVTNRGKRIVIEAQIDNYLSLVFRYVSQREGPKIHVKFEDLLSKDSADTVVGEFLGKLGVCTNGPPLTEVYKLAKESQNSLHNYNYDLKKELEAEIEKRLTYQDVLKYID